MQSGNDACIVLAEAIGGDEATFSDLMNEKASELGLLDSAVSYTHLTLPTIYSV